jgi:hypothetical protein
MQAVPNERPADGETPGKAWYWEMAKALAVWAMLALGIAYKLSARDIVMDARAWSVAVGGGLFAVCVELCVGLMILGDPPKSLTRRLLAHVGVIILVSLSLVLWVLTLVWLGVAF